MFTRIAEDESYCIRKRHLKKLTTYAHTKEVKDTSENTPKVSTEH
ncbi:hypothetical protein HMPREF9372_3698 [Sporosarcina newyorkensis 2681]|uniref:Uncharacterized protein n=1 Tax=Sporosarcina newyorkensis 2681 TaxID=1027292 RepID=F9DY17_9BACL|nr:hypothetical protein HMPREF9372_3698 [Sporosarcina newyorkensis 2681]